ncbi:hypothetical protein WJX73_002519 [Symbiochloris irregularis]|uniref:Uncharacterized protein n=1 Tax=Symbiochloris irregularis TaxID=706552 RepID=A0AAW1NPC2_9CHLO
MQSLLKLCPPALRGSFAFSSRIAASKDHISMVAVCDAEPGALLPEQYDALLSDLPEGALASPTVTELLGVEYLSPAPESALRQVKGGTYRMNGRNLLTLPVSVPRRCETPLNVHFLVDTASPHTYFTATAQAALNIDASKLSAYHAKINGVPLYVYDSDADRLVTDAHGKQQWVPSHFSGVNVLGMSFLERARALLEVSWVDGPSVTLKFPLLMLPTKAEEPD